MRWQLVGLAVLAASMTARGGVPAQLSVADVEAMTPIDTLPDPAYLDTVFGNQTLVQLQVIANDTSADFGVQLRAIRMLAAYCPTTGPCGVGTTTHDTLAAIVDSYAPITDETPKEVLRLRAAIETLGIAGRTAGLDADVSRLTQFLGHRSRDIRATTANALRVLCNTQAITPLRVRLQSEGIDQVRLAISAALRDLGTGQCGH